MQPKRIAIMGTGLVGQVLAQDLAADQDLQVLAVDASETALQRLRGHSGLQVRQADLSRTEEVAAIAGEVDLVVGAVPGWLGPTLMEGVIGAGRPLVDISFTAADLTAFDTQARRQGIPVVVDCGLAPGLSNLLAGREAADLDQVDSIVILVGGLPAERRWPYEYTFVFSPADVIEEYTRPCRFREDGVEKILPALSEVELVNFPGVGTLEAFNTDGLRTLLASVPARTMKEKTLRYPGHAEKMRILRETGLFDTTPIRVGDVEVSPRALCEKLLLRLLRRQENETELTLLRVMVQGRIQGQERRVVWDLLDRTDPASGQTSMARTTAFPCALVARMVLNGQWSQAGVHAPEHLGRDAKLTATLLEGLDRRGIRPVRRVETGGHP